MAEAGGELTVFGATLLELMARRGIRSWSALSAALRAKGHRYTPQRISNWVHARHAVSNEFTEALLEAFGDLTEEEVQRLAMAFTFGQRRPVGEPLPR